MIKTKTLLILGAGASQPFGFPLGRGLRDEIYEMLAPPAAQPLNRRDFDNIEGTIRLLMDEVGDGKSSYPSPIYGKIQDFRKALIRSGRFSVDAFLEHRLNEFEIIGKRAIVVALQKYEDPEKFEHMRQTLEGEKKNNWYALLVEALIEDVPLEEFSGKNLKIVTFNYDRSLEYYLHDSLMNSYGITTEEAAEKINEIDIIHVHGKLGDLEWQENPGCVLKYGQELSGPILAEVAKNIKIIPTDTIITPEFEKAGNMIVWADRIFILGFGFNKQNLKRLKLGPFRKDRGGVYGTGMGLRHRDFSTISALKIANLANLHRRRLKGELNFPLPNKTIYKYLWDDIDLTE